jgi:hypothetical protein
LSSSSWLLIRLQLSEQIIPLQQKKKKKEAERQRNRSHMQAEYKSLESALNLFVAEVERLKSIDKSINFFEQSSSRDEAAGLASRMEEIRTKMATAKEDLSLLQPDLIEIRKAVDDRERHRKQLQQNIDIFVAQERIESLEVEVERLEKERDSIEGAETASEDYSKLGTKKSDLLQKKARSDGMFSSHMEQIRALKVCCIRCIDESHLLNSLSGVSANSSLLNIKMSILNTGKQ